MIAPRLHNRHRYHLRGFSLIELMVTVSIVVLVTGIALSRYGSFNNTVLLKSQAYELALDIRQTQLYGVSVSGVTGEFGEPFGIYLEEGRGSYTLFQDTTNNNERYDNGEEIGEPYTIDPRFEIADIRVNGCGDVDEIPIIFERPNFDAKMRAGGNCYASSVEIELATVSGSTNVRTVVVYATGLISVE